MEPMLKFTLKKNIAIRDIKKTIWNLIDIKFRDMGVEVDHEGIKFYFDPPCGCSSFEMDMDEIPLEDLSCFCGKTKLIQFERID